jgi:hypothetical protein
MFSTSKQIPNSHEGIKSTLEVEVHKQSTIDHTTIKFTNHNSNNNNNHGYWQQPKVFTYSPLALVFLHEPVAAK